LAAEGAVGPVVVVVVLPLLEFVVEDLGVVDDHTVKEAVELFGVDAMGTFHFAVESGRLGFDVDVIDPFIEHMPMESSLKLSTVVRLDNIHTEGKPREHVVHELDRGFLIQLGIDPQHSQPSAVIDRGELVVLAPPPRPDLGAAASCSAGGGGERFDELDVDLDAVPGLLFFIPLPAPVLART
jgi:hypothetical protein